MDSRTSTSAVQGGHDHLTQLPAELLHAIFSFLLPTHTPDRPVYDAKQEKPCSHALDKVAAACKLLRSEVSEWALHFLISHKSITNFELPKSAVKKSGTVNHLRGRKGLLTWCSTHCIFCGKKSARSAILANGFRCCAACDKAQWEKITLTDARKRYGLKEENLLPNQHVNSPTSRKLVARLELPRVRYGVYTCQGAKATMFLLEDVKLLAALFHGELQSYLAKREAARVARSTKAEIKKQGVGTTKANVSRPSSFKMSPPIVTDTPDEQPRTVDQCSSHEDLGDVWLSSGVEFVED